ncbi:MAG: hypothetical protein AAF663_10965, partial [Planctomycetota bacterium]
SPKKQQAPVEPLEPRMLLSGVPTLLPESNPADGGRLKILDASHRVNAETFGNVAAGRLESLNRIDGLKPAEPATLKRVAGSAKDDILLGFSASGDFRGGQGRDTIAVLPLEDSDFSKARNQGKIDAGPDHDVIYVYEADVSIDGGSGYDIVFTDRADLTYQNVEEFWVKNSNTGAFEIQSKTSARKPFIGDLSLFTTAGVSQFWGTGGLGAEAPFGDVNGDGVIDDADVDYLFYDVPAAQRSDPPAEYDLFPDGVLDQRDVDHLIHGLAGTEYADLNLDFTIIAQLELNAVLNNWGASGNLHAEGNYVQFTEPKVGQSDLNQALNRWGFRAQTGGPAGSNNPTTGGITRYGFTRDDDGSSYSAIAGTANADFLWGGRGTDVIDGGLGADFLIGGSFDRTDGPHADVITDPDLPTGASPAPGILAHVTSSPAFTANEIELGLHFANPTDGVLVETWEVDWGEAGTPTETHYGGAVLTAPPTHSFAQAGTYEVKVRATTQLGERLGQWALDTSFGSSALVGTDLEGLAAVNVAKGTPAQDELEAITVDGSGRIVAVGRNFDKPSVATEHDAAIARFLPGGELDDDDTNGVGFSLDPGKSGFFLTVGSDARSDGSNTPEDFVGSVIDQDGRLIAAGTFRNDSLSHPKFIATLYNDQGEFDTGFTANPSGDNGIKRLDVNGTAGAVLQPAADRMLIAGSTIADTATWDDNPKPLDKQFRAAQFDTVFTTGTNPDAGTNTFRDESAANGGFGGANGDAD